MSVGGYSAGVNVRKVGVRAAFLERNTYLGRRRLVVEFNPQAFEQFERFFVIQGSGCAVFFVKGKQVLIQAAGAVRVPGVQFGSYTQVYKPVHLNRLPISFGFVSRNDLAVFRNLQKFGFALRIFFFFGHFRRQTRIAFTQNHNRIAGNIHSF